MKAVTKQAHRWVSALTQVAKQDTRGVKVSISTRVKEPYCVAATVYLPAWMFDTESDFFEFAVPSFRHELSHARDFLDGRDLGYDEAERRARRAENPRRRR